jgi:small GTP-binding protein
MEVKIVLVGQKAVGKTSVFNRFVFNDFPETQMTVGSYFANKELRAGSSLLSLAIWDTAGEEKFDSLTSYYCKGAQAALVCYGLDEGSIGFLKIL